MSPFDDDRIRIFRAPTTAAALKRVRMALGGDAVVLRTRKVVEPASHVGESPRELVEVAAAAEPLKGQPMRSRKPASARTDEPAIVGSASRLAAEPGPQLADDKRRDPGSQTAGTGLESRLATIERALFQLLEPRPDTTVQQSETPNERALPPVQQARPLAMPPRAERLVELGVSSTRATQLDAEADAAFDAAGVLRAELADDPPRTVAMAEPCSGRQVIVAMVGATGVGKTTTVAKLAATMSLYGQCRVGIVSVDSTREAADRQLRAMADVLHVPLLSAATPDDLVAAIRTLGDRDIVYIDSGGVGPTEAERAASLVGLLSAVPIDQVLLAVSAASSLASWTATHDALAEIQPDAAVLTKLDEMVQPGLCLQLPLPVAAITNGQEIPADLVASTTFDWTTIC